MTNSVTIDGMERQTDFDAEYLEQFSRLPAETQRQIIKLIRAPAKNLAVSKPDREAAEARARQLEVARRKR